MIIPITDIFLVGTGIVLLVAGLSKAISAGLFLNQLSNLKIFPKSLLPFLVVFIIELECALGSSLVLKLFPENTIPMAIVLLLAGMLITILGKLSKRIHTCGCYGHAFWIPLPASLALNAFYNLSLIWTWMVQDRYSSEYHLWQIFLVIFSIGGSGFLIKHSLKKPLFDITISRPGRKLNKLWFDQLGFTNQTDQILLVFLSDRCPICIKWINNLNYLSGFSLDYRILAVFNEEKPSASIKTADNIQFKTVFLKPSKFYFLVQQTPTALMVKDWKILEKWEVKFPDKLLLENEKSHTGEFPDMA